MSSTATEPHPQAPKLAPDGHGLIYLPEAAFAAAFAQHATTEELTVLAAVQRPISPACITVAVERPLWKDRPTWFLVAEQDRMIVEGNQRFMAERMKARMRSHPVDHMPLVTAPVGCPGHHPRGDRPEPSRADYMQPDVEEVETWQRRVAMTAINYRTAGVDGRNIFYREAGAPGAPKLLLLHGFPSASHMFRDLIPLLADRFHIVAPDLPGFGKSDMPRNAPPSTGSPTRSTASPTSSASTATPSMCSITVRRPGSGLPSGIRTGSRRSSRRTATPMRRG